jgi:hypothetical protein
MVSYNKKAEADKFPYSMKFVFKWEGGYVNDPDDPGGETKYGISKRAYPDIDIKNLTKAQAKSIYHQDYWIPAGCDKLPWPLCLVVFDTAVNMGLKRVEQFKAKSDDWIDFVFLRLEFYADLAGRKPKHKKHIRGWLNRVTDLYRTATNAD